MLRGGPRLQPDGQIRFPRTYLTHKTSYVYLSLLMGCSNIQKNLDSDLFWAGDGRFCGGFPPFCIMAPLVRSFSHFLFLRHRIICWPEPLPKEYYNRDLNQTPNHTPPGGARPTFSAQCGPICTRTPSHPRRPLPLALITPVA